MPLLISDYFMQVAERVYGDPAATEREGGAATLDFQGATDGTPRATSIT
jgi:hypothetical protein